MNGHIFIKSKTIIMGDTVRLFSVSLLSFLLRWGTCALAVFSAAAFIESGSLTYIAENYDFWVVYLIVLCSIVVFLVLLLFVCAVRLGEEFLYFSKAYGGRGRFLLLFRYCTFKRSLGAFEFYFKSFLLKLGWLLYYLLPCAVCYGIIFYLYSYGSLLTPVFYILISGGSVLLTFSLFMWQMTAFRYSAAPYYICLNSAVTPKYALKKSIQFTDGFLKESIILRSSFFGWFLSCIAVFPVVYVLPYFKITKAVFIIENLNKRMYTKQETGYAINYIALK